MNDKIDKYHFEREWLRRNGIYHRVPFGFLRYIYWRQRISAVIVLALMAVIVWWFFHVGYW